MEGKRSGGNMAIDKNGMLPDIRERIRGYKFSGGNPVPEKEATYDVILLAAYYDNDFSCELWQQLYPYTGDKEHEHKTFDKARKLGDEMITKLYPLSQFCLRDSFLKQRHALTETKVRRQRSKPIDVVGVFVQAAKDLPSLYRDGDKA